ncbi:MAG: hypothetical protein GY711_07050 [bacterium]|nr:hypothetical protein [bacterium]
MTWSHDAAIAYLRPPDGAFWCWADGGRVLTLSDGTTVAFREEIVEVLQALRDEGLPVFGSVVLLLMACRSGWRDTRTFRDLERKLQDVVVGVEPPGSQSRDQRLAMLASPRLDALERIGQLPRELRTSAARSLLVANLTRRAEHEYPPETACELVRQFVEVVPLEGFLATSAGEEDVFRLARDLEGLGPTLEELDTHELEHLLRTGLAAAPLAAPLDLDDFERVRSVLESLRADPRREGLASVARDIMAAVHLPRRVSEREEMPLGGVSDITNRGPLDRLLTSELAHDDLTLAVRLATGEALFLEREAPPQIPVGERAFLIDCGVCMWGLPRVFAISALLALAATATPRTRVRAFVAAGSQVQPVDVLSPEGIEELLETLATARHPGAALSAFEDALAADGDLVDRVVLTSEEALEDPDFLRRASELGPGELFLVTLSRDGRLRLHVRGARGQRLLREAGIDLAALFEQPVGGARGELAQYPRILQLDSLPLALPSVVRLERTVEVRGGGIVTLTDDGRILFRRSPDRCGHELARWISGTGLGPWCDESGEAWFLARGPTSLQLVEAQAESGSSRPVSLEYAVDALFPTHALVAWGVFACIFRDSLRWFDLNSGVLLGRTKLDERVTWGCGRFLSMGGRGYALSFDGSRVRLEPLPPSPDGVRCTSWLECDGEIIGLTQSGDFVRVPSGTRLGKTGTSDARILEVSRDGRRVLLVTSATTHYVAHVRGEAARKVNAGRSLATLDPELARFDNLSNPWRKFEGIQVHASGVLTLVGNKGRLLILTLGDEPAFRWHSRVDSKELCPVPFGPKTRVDGVTLREAEWPDGSRAYLDSRGMLHLVSADLDVAEITLVLSGREPGGWLSTGSTFGPSRYRIGGPTADAEEFTGALCRFMEQIG